MKKVYLLTHISYDYYEFQTVYAVSESKEKLYEQAKKDDATLPILENDENYDRKKMNDITPFLIVEFDCL